MVQSPESRLHYIQWTPGGPTDSHISEATVSGVTFILTPYSHPLLLLKWIKHDAFICKVARLFTDPHSMVLRNAVIILGTFEKSTLMDRMQRKRSSSKCQCNVTDFSFQRFEGLNRVSRVSVIERACLTSVYSVQNRTSSQSNW